MHFMSATRKISFTGILNRRIFLYPIQVISNLVTLVFQDSLKKQTLQCHEKAPSTIWHPKYSIQRNMTQEQMFIRWVWLCTSSLTITVCLFWMPKSRLLNTVNVRKPLTKESTVKKSRQSKESAMNSMRLS